MERAGRHEGEEASPGDHALPLVLLPGTLCDARVFGPLLSRLGERPVQVVSTATDDSAAALAERLLAAAPEVFVLAGFSLGGVVALEAAAQAPERLAGLALIASNPRPDAMGAAARREEVAAAARQGVASFVREKLWPRYVAAENREKSGLVDLICEMADGVGVEGFRRQAEVAISRADSRPRLAALTMPVLAMSGEADVICPPELHEEIVGGAPSAELCVIPNAGHFLLLEQPAVAAAALAAWLERIDPPRRPRPTPARSR